MLTEQKKLLLLCLLWLLMLGVVVLSATHTLWAMHNFQQENHAARAGDVTTIRPWMTLHVISHAYHISELYLDESLQVASDDISHHATLDEIAARKHQPVDQLIRTLQQIILTYREEYPDSSTPVK